MGDCTTSSNEIKIKKIIRNLKKEEIKMICGLLKIDIVSFPLLWNQYFELKKPYKGKAKYNLDELTKMDKIEFEQVINGYFNSILKSIYKEEVLNELYPIFNLPENSDIDTVKKRFRELAKKMHPDTGGTHEGFIALSQAYENFIKNMQK
jgi:hypothetical protein